MNTQEVDSSAHVPLRNNNKGNKVSLSLVPSLSGRFAAISTPNTVVGAPHAIYEVRPLFSTQPSSKNIITNKYFRGTQLPPFE